MKDDDDCQIINEFWRDDLISALETVVLASGYVNPFVAMIVCVSDGNAQIGNQIVPDHDAQKGQPC